MKFRIVLLSATVLAAPIGLSHVAKAQPVSGIYVAGGAGYNNEEKFKIKDFVANNKGEPGTAEVSLYGGYTGNVSVGYGFGNGFRIEIEGDYFYNRYNQITTATIQTGAGGRGREQKYGGFINALYDFDIGLPFLYPYVGGGLGYQRVWATDFAPANTYTNETRGAPAYQGIAGVSIPIPYVVGLSFTLEYRFTGLTGSRKYTGVANVRGSQSTIGFKELKEYNNSFLGGLRYQFDVPAPVPPAPAPATPAAAPAPAPAKTYLVFFDWDKSDLTPRATQIIAQAASDSKTQQTTTIAVNGYTDTSGTAVYNQGLSVRRANAVEAQLVTDGVPASEITAKGFGDTDLLVATGPGVREPQNRRVEIVLQ